MTDESAGRIRHLEERISFLAEELRAAMEALDVAVTLDVFPAAIGARADRKDVLGMAAEKMRALLPFHALGFLLVGEDARFDLVFCEPVEARAKLEAEIHPLIEDRTFAWALYRRKAVLVTSRDQSERVMLHGLATSTSVQGMFFGLLGKERSDILDLTLEFISVVLMSCASVLETLALNEQVSALNEHLKRQVACLEASEGELSRYRDHLEEQVRERTEELARMNQELRMEVTERRRAESELRDVLERYDRLTNNAGEAIFRIRGEDKKVVYVNPAGERLFGYSTEEWAGEENLIDKILSNEARQSLAAVIRDMEELGEARGVVLSCRTRDGRVINVDFTIVPVALDGGGIGYLEAIGRDITERMLLEARFRYQATHDALTGLPSRTLFVDHLNLAIAQAQRTAAQVGVLFIDLDNFKRVNDTLGHDVGDQLLVIVAERIKEQVRSMDTVARMGGDEFTVVLPNLRRDDEAAGIGERIRRTLEHPFLVGREVLTLSASVGIAIYPQDGEDVQTLMRRADAAMYCAKDKGRNALCAWDEAKRDRMDE